MAKVVIFGNSRATEIAHYYLKHDSDHEIVGFSVDSGYLSSDTFLDLPIFPFETLESYFPPSEYKLFIPIGPHKTNKIRTDKYKAAKQRGYQFITYISSKAVCHARVVGENCFIFEGNFIQPFVSIGNNCIFYSGCIIGHHTVIGDHCFFAANVTVGGGSKIGEFSFFGLTSTIKHDLKIGTENVIGAGSLVLNDTDDRSVYSPGETQKLRIQSNFVRLI